MKFDLSQGEDCVRAEDYFNKLLGQNARIEIKKHSGVKSARQNRYLYACFKVLSDYSGYTVEEIKQILKTTSSVMVIEKGGHRFLRSISELDSKEMTTFIDEVRSFGLDHDCYIFSPDEFYQNQFNIEKQLGM